VVTQIFHWRALERLSYGDIAQRLNADPDRYPPPEPILGRGRRRIGAWTPNNVREVLDNPKHTGYMVWNRRKNPRQSRGLPGRVNPPNQWVWSSRPTHEPLVTRALFEAATTIGRFRRGSRSGSSRNRNPITKRTYVLRSYVVCDLCGRRMCGQTRKQYTYYRCGINKPNHGQQPWYDSHPANVLIREDLIVEPLATFFAERILGPNRAALLHAEAADQREDQKFRAIQTEIAELRRRRANVAEELQTYRPTGDQDVDTAWRDTLRTRFAALVTAERTNAETLIKITREQQQDQATDLLDQIPKIKLDVTALPEDHQRQLYDAFHLQIRYDAHRHELTLRVTLDADTAEALAKTVCDASRAPGRPRGPSQTIAEQGKRLLIEQKVRLVGV
jgi:site-specific DNA recombinase